MSIGGLVYGEDEFLCKRTFNAVRKLIANLNESIRFDLRYGFITEEEYKERMHICSMMIGCLVKSGFEYLK